MRKLMQKGSKLLAFFVALAMTSLFCLDGSFAIETNAETILSAAQIVEEMGVGWNLGNSLDAFGAGSISGHETYWGNPVVTEDLIKAVKAKGFNTVRVPVTWYEHITVSGSTYTIDTAWLARVKQVVDYAYNNGMYVILNIHHEDWINRSDFNSSYTAMSTELKQVWTQIASYFSDYGQRLIFEGMNEPRAVGNDSINQWTGNSACYDVVNKLDADFISTVRSVDSPYKTNRLLMVPGYAASGDYGIYSSLDKDLFSDPYVAASVHAYKPYDFAMNDEADHSDFSSEYKAQLDGIFGDLRSFFTQDDIPVVIGEFSTSNYGYTAARVDWAEYYMTLAKEIGAACVLWDNNAETNSSNPSEAHGYINRSNNTWYSASESVVNKLISVRNDNSIIWGSKSSYPLYPHENFSSGTAVNLSGAVMNTSGMSGFTSGTELAIKYTSDISLKIALMNGSYQGWTELSPYDFTYTDSYTIAYVKYDDIYGAWNGANGDLAYIKVIDSDYNDVSCSVMVLNVKASHTHTLADKYSSDATGHWYACSGCSEKVNFEKHTEDSGTVTKQPTETTEGEKTYKCTKCKYVIRTESITKLDHSHDLAATYSSDATGHWYACSGCSEKVNFEKHTEDSGTVTKQPTETEEGEKTYKCTKCKYVIRTESITKLDHSHDLAATYSSDATGHWYACSGCSEKVNFEKHTEDSGTITKQPTETTEGEKTYKCTKCKYVIRTEAIDPDGDDELHLDVDKNRVSLGYGHSAYITENGDLYMWGRNDYGQLGDGTYIDKDTPVKIMSNVSQVSLGFNHSACITTNGDLYTWGYNGSGRLGDGTSLYLTPSKSSPQKIMSNVAQVSLGWEHSACITTSGDLYTWGDNSYNQIGDGTNDKWFSPLKIMSNVVQISVGNYHSACITADGELYMWGRNGYGQLGNGATTSYHIPERIATNVSQVILGGNHSAYISQNGDLYMWGRNYFSQLGDGATTDCYTPKKVMSNVSQVSLGGDYSAYITVNGDLYTWGCNYYGQLGDGTTVHKDSLVKIKSNVAKIILGDRHSACITTSGELYTWGWNEYGQIGDGTTTDKTKPVKITIYENGAPVTVYDGTETKTFDTLTAALTAYKTSTKALTITLNKDADVKTISLPTKAASITITGSGALNVNAASISIPANTKIDVALNGTNAKPLAVKVSAGKTLDINSETSNIGAVSGTKTSVLNVNADMTAASLATFGEVNIASGKALTVTGKITAVTTLNGKVILPTTAASAAVTTIETAEIILTDGNLAKVTVNDVTESLTVNVVNANGETVTLASGTTILYTAGKTDYTGKVTIANKTSTGLDLTAFLYTKEIKAEYAGAVTLYDGTEYKAYPNVTLPLAAMKDVTKDYVLILNEDISAAKITLPTKANSLTIKSANAYDVKTLSLTGVTSLSARIPLTLENVRIESTRSFSLSASKDLNLDNFNSESISAIKGGSKFRLTMGETELQYVSNTKTGEISSPAVSGFGTIDLNAPFKVGKTFTTLTIDLGASAELTVPGTKSTVSTKTLYGEEGSVIKFETGFTPVRITGTTADFVTGKIKLKADGTISESTVLFTTKTVGNGVFDVTEIQPFDATVDYTMAIISGKAYIRPIALDLDGTKYALWTDVIAAIEAAKASTADYTVTLLDDYNIGGAMKLPKAGTYGSLTITSDNKTLSFTGNVTSTGALNIVNTSLDSAKNGVSAKYTVSAGKYQFCAENVDFNLASGLSATGDVTLKNVTLNGTIKAGILTLNGTNTVLGTVSAYELNSTESGTVLNILNNSKGVISVTKNGITEGSEEITLRLVNADGSAAAAENGAIIASSFKGSYDGQLKLSTDNGIFNIVLTAKGKLVLASEALNSTDALDEESETEEEEESSEDEESEEDEDTSDDTTEEEDDTSEGDEDNGEEGETSEGDEDTSEEDDGTDDSSDETEGDEPVSDETDGDTSDMTIE